jgi:hypothetical protein
MSGIRHYVSMPASRNNQLAKIPAPTQIIERRIYVVRGQKVMLDSDLAELYRVETKMLNRAVRRNLDRFPPDFMFQLKPSEADALRCQFGTSNSTRGGRRYRPLVFTEHGVAMLASVLNSDRAVKMSILIIRAFVKLRELLASHKELASRVENIESAQRRQGSLIAILASEVGDLKRPAAPSSKRRIGFPSPP